MFEFLVIGGGIAGVSAAARLSTLGKTALVEAETALAYHASGRSAALFEANYGKPAVIALNQASFDYHKSEHGGVLSPRGLMLLGNDETVDQFETDIASMQLSRLSRVDALALVPSLRPEANRVAYNENAWDIDTDRLIQNFAKTLRANGGEIKLGTGVSKIVKSNNTWHVTVGENTFAARNIVNAAGPWADDIAKMAGIAPIGITPYRRSMARVAAPADIDVNKWPMIFGAGEDWYCKPDAGAMIISPADEDATTPHDAYADDMTLAEGIARFQEHIDFEVTRMLANWAGLRSFSPDRVLVIGHEPADPSFLWCAGQGGYGMQSAPAASQLLADIANGSQTMLDDDIVAQLSPARLR